MHNLTPEQFNRLVINRNELTNLINEIENISNDPFDIRDLILKASLHLGFTENELISKRQN